MKNYKQLIAGAMATIMVLGSSVITFAAEGTGTGTGSLDIVEKADVFNVVLPTSAGTDFNYILDPTGVIDATNAEKYAGATFGAGTLFFKNDETNYSNTSNEITVTNKSSVDVDVTVTASVAEVSGITMVSGGDFTSDNDTDAKLYLALKDNVSNTTGTAIMDDGLEVTAQLTGAGDQYEVKYVSDGDYYEKVLKADAAGFAEYKFSLTGACNPNGDWNALKDAPPTVEVIWTVEDPTNAGPKVTLTADGLIMMTGLTADANFAHSAILNYKGLKSELNSDKNLKWLLDDWSKETGGSLGFQLNAAWLKALQGCEVTIDVKLTDGSTITSNKVQF